MHACIYLKMSLHSSAARCASSPPLVRRRRAPAPAPLRTRTRRAPARGRRANPGGGDHPPRRTAAARTPTCWLSAISAGFRTPVRRPDLEPVGPLALALESSEQCARQWVPLRAGDFWRPGGAPFWGHWGFHSFWGHGRRCVSFWRNSFGRNPFWRTQRGVRGARGGFG